jgi:hypothetical protein
MSEKKKKNFIPFEKQKNGFIPFGLTPAEYDNLKDMLRYGIVIVTTVAITFVIVALVAKSVGY